MWTLFDDALSQALQEPHQAAAWRSVFAAAQELILDGHAEQVHGRLMAIEDLDVRSEVLRWTLMRDLFGNTDYAEKAADFALQIQPGGVDRLASLAAYGWGHAVKFGASKHQFVYRLKQGKVPELVAAMTADAKCLLPDGLVPRVPTQVKRVAVILPHAGHAGHTPSAMVISQCEVLVRCGMTVQLFACQELSAAQPDLYSGSPEGVLLGPIDLAYWQTHLPAGVSLDVAADHRISLHNRWRNMLGKLSQFDPDLVWVIGLYSPLASAIYERRPLMVMNVHACPPIGAADVWLTSDLMAAQEGGLWDGAQNWVPHLHPFRMKPPMVTGTLTRESLNIGQDAVVCITVGARLASECPQEWVSGVLEVLRMSKNSVWLLVGGDGSKPPNLPERVDGVSVIVLGHRSDMGDLLRLSDVYLNPPRMGGGFSVAEAMASGCAVVALGDGDGGDKLGPFAMPTQEAYFDFLRKILENPLRRAIQSGSLLERFNSRLNLMYSDESLLCAMDLALKKATPRILK